MFCSIQRAQSEPTVDFVSSLRMVDAAQQTIRDLSTYGTLHSALKTIWFSLTMITCSLTSVAAKECVLRVCGIVTFLSAETAVKINLAVYYARWSKTSNRRKISPNPGIFSRNIKLCTYSKKHLAFHSMFSNFLWLSKSMKYHTTELVRSTSKTIICYHFNANFVTFL